MRKNYLMGVGLLLLSTSMVLYLYDGYNTLVLLLWLFSIVFAAAWFRRFPSEGVTTPCFTQQDLVIAAILTAVISVFYLSVTPTHPMQMVGDEVATTVKALVLSQPDVDMFKPSDYYNLPAPFFAISGHLANLFGFIDVMNIRLVTTLFGIIICAISYFFFRRIFPDRFKAIVSTLLLAGSHSLFTISHIGALNNSAILVYLLSVLFLFIGLQRGSRYYAFIGGVFAAFGWYVYSPAKIIIFIWIATLVVIALLRYIKLVKSDRFRYSILATLVGFSFAICPFIIGALTTPQEGDTTWAYQQNQFLLSHVGWSDYYYKDSNTWYDSVVSNALSALTAFNSKEQDKGYIYNHWGRHGFVDPISGVLLWIGVLSILLTLRRQRIEWVIVLLHFLLLLFAFMFLVNRAPNYTRLLIMLPFIIPLVVIASSTISRGIARIVPFVHNLRREIVERVFLGMVIILIIFLNVGIFADYVRYGILHRDSMSDTVRYIHDQSKNQQKLYFFDDQGESYYLERWDTSDWQRVWINLFVVFNGPPKNLTLLYWTSYRHKRDLVFFNDDENHREPIANTIYYIVNQISKSPHRFYLVRDSQEDTHPDEFVSRYDWEIWLNLFTVFKQPFDVVEPDNSLITQSHKFPRTFFIPKYIWNDVRERVLSAHEVVDVHYLSSKRDLLIVRIGGGLNERQ